ncbi:Biopolymer transport protein (plasmid) [Phaeobacter inhibens]|uniref:Biopolymer transport protein n=1 Tax=Phaeobacter inhibens TaxID=221822 RepID=A0ABM6RK57_9RHOB|nr:biopolymer transporter ExbD [Phaeobacter inhibens]AUQ52327.1 Biopolymer transport protein [Phaeobacter inhibens]AUQ96932.1 Biopolymer transport protein [Phaeobacter inhibens]AUR05973.1 Biopolymer transport protein [Phaeobacter inhibens]AUR22133.1 Biopolymer transport protein [Phaeobacter inhibens]UWR66836.1 biopolymer transporter ExbD [Phaeobacter inhibens]
MRIRPHTATQKEPTIALINIVFLMLIFFMIAGTLAVPLDKDVTLIEARDLEGREPPDALVVHADGKLTLRGKVLADAATYVAMLTEDERAEVRIVPDRDLPARDLVKLGNALRAAGAQQVLLVSERALQ